METIPTYGLKANKGYNTAGQSPAPCDYSAVPQQSYRVLYPSVPHSLDHARAKHGRDLAPFVNKIVPHSSPLIPNLADLWQEYNALGFLRNTHPLALWKDDVLAVKYRVKALHLGEHIGQFVRMVGWPVTQKDVWTKDGFV